MFQIWIMWVKFQPSNWNFYHISDPNSCNNINCQFVLASYFLYKWNFFLLYLYFHAPIYCIILPVCYLMQLTWHMYNKWAVCSSHSKLNHMFQNSIICFQIRSYASNLDHMIEKRLNYCPLSDLSNIALHFKTLPYNTSKRSLSGLKDSPLVK